MRALADWQQRDRWAGPPCLVHVVDLDGLVRGEYAENTVRKDFSPTEATAILRALKPYEEAEAKERQRAAGKTYGRGKKKASAKRTEAKSKGESRKRAAKATGYSAATLAKVTAVEEAAAAEPGVYDDLVEQLNTAKKGAVNGIYRAFQKRKQLRALKAAQAHVTALKRKQFQAVCDLRVCSCAALFKSGIVPDAVITDPP